MIKNFELAKQVAEEYKIPLALLCAVIEKESNGHHIYGHDADGVHSTRGRTVIVDGLVYGGGANVPVTSRNFAEFERRVLAGEKSNGVGIMQITYAGAVRADGTRDGGYFRAAREKGFDLSKELDNIRMGADIIKAHFQRAGSIPSKDAVVYVGTKYNGRFTYGEDLWVKFQAWEKKLDELAERAGDVDNVEQVDYDEVIKLLTSKVEELSTKVNALSAAVEVFGKQATETAELLDALRSNLHKV